MAENVKNTVAEEENEIEQQRNVEKVVARCLFLSAMESKTNKIGVTVMLVDDMDLTTGQVKVTLEQKKAGKQSYTVSPVICTWFDPSNTDEQIFAEMKALTKAGGLKDLYIVMSGDGEFRRIHKVLSRQELELYRKLVG